MVRRDAVEVGKEGLPGRDRERGVIPYLSDWALRWLRPVALPHLIERDANHAVWEVPLPSGRSCYMSVRGGGADTDHFVVIVDADRFFQRWQRSAAGEGRNAQIPVPPKERLHLDRKYPDAEEGVAQGRANPVPLACAGANPPRYPHEISFTNGITRTFWLIANGAEAFPVMVVGQRSAKRLHALAGAGPRPIALDRLFSHAAIDDAVH